MRQAFVIGRGRIEIREAIKPQVDAKDLIARVLRAGVCGTDVYLVHSPKPFPWNDRSYPFPLGHEWVGEIEAIGAEFPRYDSHGVPLKVGDRIVVYPSTWACGKCYACRMLLQPNLCLRPDFGRDLPKAMNAFADYFYVPEGSALFRVPDEVSTDAAVLTEPMAAALRAFERSFSPGLPDRGAGMGPGKSMVVLGSGTIGALLTALGRISGAYPLIVIGAPDHRLEICAELGADIVISIQAKNRMDRIRLVQESTVMGLGADVVIEAAGVPAAFVDGIEMTRTGGCLVEVGHYTDRGTVEFNPLSICRKDITIFGSWGYGPHEFGAALRILRRQKEAIHPERIITHRFPLDQVAAAVDVAKSQFGMKVVINTASANTAVG